MSNKKTANFGNVNVDAKDFQYENVRASTSIRVPLGFSKPTNAKLIAKESDIKH